MTKLNISTNHLLAVVHAASNEETRYYLRGVSVEFLPDRTIYTATDGNILMCSQHAAENPSGIAPMIVDRDSIKQLKIDKFEKTSELPSYDVLDNRLAGTDHILKLIDGTFPDWRRVIPQECSGEKANFDLAKFAPFVAVCKKFSDHIDGMTAIPEIAQNGLNCAFVHMCTLNNDSIFGVIMPKRPANIESGKLAPSWVHETTFPPEQSAPLNIAAE